jgi:hypothetical protein
MPHRKIANWTTIREMCRQRFAGHTVEEVEDDDEDAEAEMERDSELCDAEATVRAAAAQRDDEMAMRGAAEHQERRRAEDLAEARVKVEAVLAKAEDERVAKVEAPEHDTAERAAHWAAEMNKALAYRRNVDRREGGRRAETQHHLERRQTLRRQDTAIRATMAAIDNAGPAGHGDGAAQPKGDGGGGYVPTTSGAGTVVAAKTNR